MTEIHPTGEALRRLDPESKERRLKRGMRNRSHLAHFVPKIRVIFPAPSPTVQTGAAVSGRFHR